jgi:Ca-activated chloride channel homolog
MTFERTWVLIFLLLPLGWMFFEWRRTRRITALLLKTLAFLAIILALAEPTLTVPQTKMAVAVLVDTSSSVSPQDLTRASDFAAALDKAHGRHWVRILPFARSVRDLAASEQRGLRLEPTAGEAGRATDLESSIDEAVASLPSGLVPRIVLVSDGKENAGSITRAAWQAQRLGIPIDTVALTGRPQPTLRLESVTVPTVAFTGEQFPVDLSIASPSAVSGTVQISAEGKLLGSNPVKLDKGDNQVRVHASLTAAGALSLSGVIQANGLGEIRFDRAVTLRRPKVLYISHDPAGTETHLLQITNSWS